MHTPFIRRDNPLEALWSVRAILWVLGAGVGVSLVVTLASPTDASRWALLWRISVVVEWILLTTLAMMYGLNRLLARLRAQRVAYIALALLLANTWAAVSILWLIFRPVAATQVPTWQDVSLRASGIALAVGLLGLAAFQNHRRARQLAIRTKQAELEALQARIRPHFLFNTLNTGVALVHQRPEEAERLLVDLADLFRAALAGPRDIPLADELALARRYLEIESLRFAERLHVLWQLPDQLPTVNVPALSIQPLVENAIRHGIERMPGGGAVEITVEVLRDAVLIQVANPLPSTATAAPGAGGHRVGLSSSQARIEALTGGRGHLQAGVENGRYVASVRVPLPATE